MVGSRLPEGLFRLGQVKVPDKASGCLWIDAICFGRGVVG